MKKAIRDFLWLVICGMRSTYSLGIGLRPPTTALFT